MGATSTDMANDGSLVTEAELLAGYEQKSRKIRGLETAWLEARPSKERQQDAPILIFLHGFPDTAESWSYQLDHFKGRYWVVAPFIRGAAPSEPGRDLRRYGTSAIALDHLAILTAVDPTKTRRVFIVGHDLGCVHAWSLARLLGPRAAGLVVINGLTVGQMARRLTAPRQLKKSWYMFLMQIPFFPELAVSIAPRKLVALAHAKGELPQEIRPPLRSLVGATVGPLNQYRALAREIPRSILTKEARLVCPVLVLWSARDAFLEPINADEIKPDARDVTIRILPSNHWVQRSNPEQINALIAEFLQKKE